jgi:hypothetical protein
MAQTVVTNGFPVQEFGENKSSESVEYNGKYHLDSRWCENIKLRLEIRRKGMGELLIMRFFCEAVLFGGGAGSIPRPEYVVHSLVSATTPDKR